MGFMDRFIKCPICGEKFGSKQYEIANYKRICLKCFNLASFSKIELLKKPIQKMTFNEISEIIDYNEKLKKEIGNVLDKNIIGLLRSAKRQLNEEKILHWIYGVYKTKSLGTYAIKNGVFIATDRQIFFYAERFTGYETESFPLSNITSLESGEGALGAKINIIASGNRAEVFGISHGQINQFVDYVRCQIGKSSDNISPLPLDSADQLRKYKLLLDDEIISEEEFNIKKRELLGL